VWPKISIGNFLLSLPLFRLTAPKCSLLSYRPIDVSRNCNTEHCLDILMKCHYRLAGLRNLLSPRRINILSKSSSVSFLNDDSIYYFFNTHSHALSLSLSLSLSHIHTHTHTHTHLFISTKRKPIAWNCHLLGRSVRDLFPTSTFSSSEDPLRNQYWHKPIQLCFFIFSFYSKIFGAGENHPTENRRRRTIFIL
jgi:hypothetical protein